MSLLPARRSATTPEHPGCADVRLSRGTTHPREVASVSTPPPDASTGASRPASGDARRAAVTAERGAVLAHARCEGWSTAAVTGGRTHPAHHAPGARRMRATQRVAAATPLTAPRGGTYSWKWDNHAHETHLSLHCLCQSWFALSRTTDRLEASSAGGAMPRQGRTYRKDRATVPGWIDASSAVLARPR